MITNKHYSYIPVWVKYIPVLRILIKKSATEDQLFQFNRADFERAGYARKTGYKFAVSFIDNKPDMIFAGNELIQTFVSVLQEDDIIRQLFINSQYSFTFSSQFILGIKNNGQNNQLQILDDVLVHT